MSFQIVLLMVANLSDCHLDVTAPPPTAPKGLQDTLWLHLGFPILIAPAPAPLKLRRDFHCSVNRSELEASEVSGGHPDSGFEQLMRSLMRSDSRCHKVYVGATTLGTTLPVGVSFHPASVVVVFAVRVSRRKFILAVASAWPLEA